MDPRALVLALALAAQERPGPPTRWTVADGLPQGTINDVVQTPEGELWIATFGGLLRFDGLRFDALDLGTTPALPSHRITALDGDGADGLWACTQDGDLAHVVHGEVLEVRSDGRVLEALDMLRHPDGALWVAATDGRIWRVTEAWTEVGSVGRPSFNAFALLPDGSVLAGGRHGLARFAADGSANGEWRTTRVVTSLAGGVDGRVLVGFVGALSVFHDGALRQLEVEPPLVESVTSLWWDGGRDVLLGLNGVLLAGELDGERLRVVECTPRPPELRDVRVLVRDAEDNLWLGSAGGGLERRRSPSGSAGVLRIGTRGVTALLEDPEGRLWIASECAGLRSYSGPALEERYWPVTPGPADGEPCVQALGVDPAGRLWLAASEQVLCMGTEGFDPPAWRTALTSTVTALLADEADGMWAIESQGDLVHLAGDGSIAERVPLGARAQALVRAHDGALWIGGDGRLWRHAAGETQTWGRDAGLPPGRVRAMLADPDGTLWLALYGGGLVRFRDGRARRWSSDDGLPDNSCSGIVDDGQGRIWVLCNRGVAVLERAQLEREGRLTPILIGSELEVGEGNSGWPAAIRTAEGELWFGTIEGAVHVHAHDFPFRARAPIARIDRVLADDVELEAGQPVPALTRRLELQFTAFALTVPERVRFRVRLDPFEEEWRDNGYERTVSYTGLSPGDYHFQVSARSDQGVWSRVPAELELVVLPAWWQRDAVQASAAVLALVLVMLAYRARVGMLQRRAQVLLDAIGARNRAEQEQSRLRDELAHVSRMATTEGLAASLAHEVNQPLASITTNAAAARRLLEREPLDVDELREILSDISSEGRRASDVVRSLREFLGKRTSERRPFSPDELVRDTLPLVQREFDDHEVELEVALGGEHARVLGDRVQVQQVLVNLLKNACEAFPATQSTRLVRVHSCSEHGRYRVDIFDNGPGLAPEVARDLFRSFVTTKDKGMGLGLSISSTIAEAHGGRLRSVGGPNGGAHFELDLPLVEDDG